MIVQKQKNIKLPSYPPPAASTASTASANLPPTFYGTLNSCTKPIAPSKDLDQPVHLHYMVRIFIVHILGSQGFKVSSC